MILRLCQRLADTPWSIALHESQYAYAVLESIHVWALAVFLSMAILLDLRLVGLALRGVPVTSIIQRLQPWTKGGFAVMVLSGLLLFFAIPVRTYHSVFFRLKLIMLVLAGVNAWWFHRTTYRDIAAWDVAARIPARARLAGAVSLFLWAGIVLAGRMIAYNWFDCDAPQSAIVIWAAGCQTDGAD